jgi:hypothetical protein
MWLRDSLFSNEPKGRRTGLVYLSLSFLSLLGWAYYGLLHGGPHMLLALGVSFAFTGAAESLPTDRQRLAGVLRLVAVGILACFLLLVVAVPEVVLG